MNYLADIHKIFEIIVKAEPIIVVFMLISLMVIIVVISTNIPYPGNVILVVVIAIIISQIYITNNDEKREIEKLEENIINLEKQIDKSTKNNEFNQQYNVITKTDNDKLQNQEHSKIMEHFEGKIIYNTQQMLEDIKVNQVFDSLGYNVHPASVFLRSNCNWLTFPNGQISNKFGMVSEDIFYKYFKINEYMPPTANNKLFVEDYLLGKIYIKINII
jgi:hypothetical protein